MLFKIDEFLCGWPSLIINKITCGSKGSSLCGRMYLRSKYCKRPYFAKSFVFLVDSIEHKHCLNAARHWRKEVRAGKVTRPDVFIDWFN